MDSQADILTSPTRYLLRPMAGYRVTAWHRDHGQSRVTLAENLRQAVIRAKAFCDEIATGRDGTVSVRVGEWTGTRTEGEWRPVSPRFGGFSHRFVIQSRTDKSRNGEDRNPSLPRGGDRVECVLLNAKTRKGGWRAKLTKRPIEGPIMNTGNVPTSAEPGQTVTLCVGAISHDGKRIQFHWQQADNAAG